MKTYVITGATSGIGFEVLSLLADDSIVFACYRNSDLIEKIKSLSSNIIPVYLDYSESASICEAANFIASKTDHIDVLFNVAGCVVAGAMENISVSDIKHQFEINTFGHFEFSQKLLPLLDCGRIINISSMAAFGIFPFIAPYCASKSALDILFNLFSLEMKQNTKIISVKPGVIATPLWSKAISENKNNIDNSVNYNSESQYLIKNAKENEQSGISVKKAASKIVKIANIKNPKPSYCIGFESYVSSLFVKLPLQIQNFFIKQQLKKLR